MCLFKCLKQSLYSKISNSVESGERNKSGECIIEGTVASWVV